MKKSEQKSPRPKRRGPRRLGSGGVVTTPGEYIVPLTPEFPLDWKFEGLMLGIGLVLVVGAYLLEVLLPGEHNGRVLATLTGTNLLAILGAWPLLAYEIWTAVDRIRSREANPAYAKRRAGIITTLFAPLEEFTFRQGGVMLASTVLSILWPLVRRPDFVPVPMDAVSEVVLKVIGLYHVFLTPDMAVASVFVAGIFGYMHRGYDPYYLQFGFNLNTLMIVGERAILSLYYTEVFLAGGLLPASVLHMACNGLLFVSSIIALRRARAWQQ